VPNVVRRIAADNARRISAGIAGPTFMPTPEELEAVRLAMTKQEMLSRHLKGRDIDSSRVLDAIARVAREEFVPHVFRYAAYDDRALEIDCGQTISQPYMVALMTQSLNLGPHDRVLEIGTGSGYQTAILAELALHVVTVERHRLLSEQARQRLERLGYRNVTYVVSDGSLGWPHESPYERILVTAAAHDVPHELFKQLAEGGVMVVPIGDAGGQVLYAVDKIGGRPRQVALVGCRFVPLISSH
jgi:protein-L-isoaspartate(D-aspartate) O-methyltransferase